MSESYASGNWVVNRGREEEFVSRWVEFLEWTRASARGLRAAHLIQESDEPRHFISFASWDSAEAMQAWRSSAEFGKRLSACRALCDEFRGSSYREAASV